MNEFGLAEGWGVTTIEHRELQSDAPDEANKYENCFYACKFCNSARATKPLKNAQGCAALDPTVHAWSEHFEARDHQLLPTTEDGQQTDDVYDLNDPRKVRMRKERSDNLHRNLTIIREGRQTVNRFEQMAQKLSQSSVEQKRRDGEFLLEQAQGKQREIARASAEIKRYLAIPADKPVKCRCSNSKFTIPPQIAEQLIDI